MHGSFKRNCNILITKQYIEGYLNEGCYFICVQQPHLKYLSNKSLIHKIIFKTVRLFCTRLVILHFMCPNLPFILPLKMFPYGVVAVQSGDGLTDTVCDTRLLILHFACSNLAFILVSQDVPLWRCCRPIWRWVNRYSV